MQTSTPPLLIQKEKVSRRLLLRVFDRVELVDPGPEIGRIAPKRNLQLLQKGVHAAEERLGRVRRALHARLAVVDDDSVGEVGRHDKVVLDNKGGLFGVDDEALDHLGGDDALLRVEVRGRLVDEVNVGGLAEAEHERDALKLSSRQVLHLLVDNGLDHHRLDDVRLKLRVVERAFDLFVKQHAHGASESRRNLLGLVADVHFGNRFLDVGLEKTGEHANKRRFSRPVFSQHDDDLAFAKRATFDVELKVPRFLLFADERLGHRRVVVLLSARARASRFVVVGGLRHFKVERKVAESKIFRRHKASEENVDAFADAERHRHDAVRAGNAVEAAHKVRKVVEDGEIVLDADDVRGGRNFQEAANDERRFHALAHIEVTRRLVKHVRVGVLEGDDADGESLQLSARKHVDVAIGKMGEVEIDHELIHLFPLVFRGENVADASLDGAGDMVDVLRLEHGLDVVLEHLGKVVLELASAKVLQDFVPVGRRSKVAQVGLELSRENLESGALADTVGADESEDLSRTRQGKPVQLERVGAVPVGSLLFEIFGQIDDLHRLKGAFFHADTATDAKLLGNLGNFRIGLYFDAKLSHANDGARFLALLLAFLRLALFRRNDGDSRKTIAIVAPLGFFLSHIGCRWK